MRSDQVKLNIGCGGRPLEGYINIDTDSLYKLEVRYPETVFPKDLEIYDFNIFDLPYGAGEVDEVRADSLVEHLSFLEESKFFHEVRRVLRPGGTLDFSTTNFEKIIEIWLDADDEWKGFYRSDNEAITKEHWFGQYSYSTKSRWGYLTAMIFGSQNGDGQYHKNCYTIKKIRAILNYLGFEEVKMSEFFWKGYRDPMIRTLAKKI